MAAQKFRSFTLRVPDKMYLELATRAQGQGVPLNQMANQLLKLGLGEAISLDEALKRLLLRTVTTETADVATV